ncbi:hypothetical protein AVEN_102782-1 [Araneus ventricosus]|uniref:Uncharacterized protein n=1 Tax=Araneus ventricosus TaxID=182803 RepID=A0A4Y2QMF0_ARAVE|nr:hypothetical protein AVEN_135580-1 [Araneus ventricosus]GBN64397.1 hypothetical protein AVEN_102782-1 [Araneus ventricosus]
MQLYCHVQIIGTNNDEPFTEEEITSAVSKLPDGKSPGYDGIDNIVVKNIYKKFPFFFTAFFNKGLEMGIYPDPFKAGNITLFQRRLSAYRPIALLPTIAKRLEKLMTQRLAYFLECKNKISPYQFGFRESRSVDLALHTLLSCSDLSFTPERIRGSVPIPRTPRSRVNERCFG